MKMQTDYYNEYLQLESGCKQHNFVCKELADSITSFVGEATYFDHIRQISLSQYWGIDTMCNLEEKATWLFNNRELVLNWLRKIAEHNKSDDCIHYANINLEPLSQLKERTDVIERLLIDGDTTHKNTMQIADYLCRTVATSFAKGFMLYVEEQTSKQVVWF